jgi:hypothetical protein
MVPQYRMLGGQCGWISDPDMHFCCRDGEILELTSSERDVLEQSVALTKTVDG